MLSLNDNNTDLLNTKRFKRQEFYSEIKYAVQAYAASARDNSVDVGVVGIDYWNHYVSYIVPSLLYEKRSFYGDGEAVRSDIIIAPSGYKNEKYEFHKSLNIYNEQFVIMFKR
jgi:hypothetical protein